MPPKRAKPTTDAPPAETDAEADVQVHGEGAGAHDATNDAEPRTEDAATTDEKTTTTKDAGGERSPRGHVGQTPKGTSSAPSAAMDPMNYLLPEEQYANVRAMLAAAVNDVSTKLQNRTPSMMLYEHCQRSAKHGARERPHVLRWTETIDPTAEEDDDDAKTKKKKKPSTKATTKAKSEDVDAGEGAHQQPQRQRHGHRQPETHQNPAHTGQHVAEEGFLDEQLLQGSKHLQRPGEQAVRRQAGVGGQVPAGEKHQPAGAAQQQPLTPVQGLPEVQPAAARPGGGGGGTLNMPRAGAGGAGDEAVLQGNGHRRLLFTGQRVQNAVRKLSP